MRFVLFSGATEGRRLSRELARLGAEVTVCVATEYGREEQGEAEGVTVLSGRMDEGEMARAVQGAALCVDATHPYAVQASENIRAACEAVGAPLLRLLRESGEPPEGAQAFASAQEAADWLKGLAACGAAGVPGRNIIALQGPFSQELNEALIRQYHIKYLVTKDGGRAGGFAEKVRAAQAAGAALVLIRRPKDEGLDYETVWKKCREMMGCG